MSTRKDRISQLPVEILQEILSFLPTNLSVSTCLLSTRWKNIWKGVPRLHFDDIQYFTNVNASQIKFIDFVDKAFLLCNADLIKRFLLSCQLILHPSWFDPWISWLRHRNMEEISIQVITLDDHFLHLDLLNCKSFKINASSFIRFQSSVSFFRLKILHLNSVRVTTCDKEIRRVCVSCHVLEELDLSCQWVNIEVVTFLVPTLKKLTVCMDNDQKLEIKFLAECLVSLHLTTCTFYKLSLSNLLLLREAFLDFDYGSGWIDEISYVRTLFKTISGLQYLTLSDETIKELWSYDHLAELRAFSSLKFLKIEILNGYILDGYHFKELFRFLHNIEGLVFNGGFLIDRDDFDDGEIGESHGWDVESTPQPSLPNLKSVALSKVDGNKKELGLVKFLLKNASALEKIKITSDSYLSMDPEKHLEFSKQLQILSTLSTVCSVDFS